MTADQVLAVVGASAGAGSFAGWSASVWWHNRVPIGQRQLLRHFYVYCDDRIGATKTENIRRANRRHWLIHRRAWWLWLVPFFYVKLIRVAVADFFWPVPQLGTGTAALPSTKRMGRYIQLELRGGTSFRKPYQLWNVHAVIVRPTSEVDAHASGTVAAVGRWVAWAMRLPSTDDLDHDDPKTTLPLGYLRFFRKAPEPEWTPPTVPMGVNADA